MARPQSSAPITVALLGGGTVGAEVARRLVSGGSDLSSRVGAPVVLTQIAVQDTARSRPGIDPSILTADAQAVATSGADVVVELIGGIEPARQLILEAMRAGSSVVTANKALLAADGAVLYAEAARCGVDLFFEASVAGAIPLLRPLRESLAGDHVTKVIGIVNGTTNYILTQMDEQGAGYASALAEAQVLGYAEADPTADVEGLDAAAKAAILAELAFHSRVTDKDVFCEGIAQVTAADITAARDMGFVIKLLAVAELVRDEQQRATGIIVRVHPAMVPRSHPLASVRGSFNAVYVHADAAGELMFYGRGAGGAPTASAVLGDIVAAARNKVAGVRDVGESTYANLPILDIGQSLTCYYVNLEVDDRPGVLASIAKAFAEHGVSIQVVRQDGNAQATSGASLFVRTHQATDSALRATVESLRQLDTVKHVRGVMRVEGEVGE